MIHDENRHDEVHSIASTLLHEGGYGSIKLVNDTHSYNLQLKHFKSTYSEAILEVVK